MTGVQLLTMQRFSRRCGVYTVCEPRPPSVPLCSGCSFPGQKAPGREAQIIIAACSMSLWLQKAWFVQDCQVAPACTVGTAILQQSVWHWDCRILVHWWHASIVSWYKNRLVRQLRRHCACLSRAVWTRQPSDLLKATEDVQATRGSWWLGAQADKTISPFF
jgi:hypothetical protein